MSGRIRTIKPEWLEDEKLALASPETRVLSVALLLLADDHGNGRMVPQIMASRVFPTSPGIFAKALDDLVGIGFVTLYRCGEQTYFSIRNWKKHQRVDKPGNPRVPGPLDDNSETIPGILAKVPVSLAPDPDPDLDHDQDQDHDQDPIPALRKKPARAKRGTPSAPAGKPDGYFGAVDLWFVCYEAVYGKKPPWGAVQGRQMQNALRKAPDWAELIPQFFHGPYPDSIRDGHPLSTGYTSFAMRLEMLRADLANPQRRASAAATASRIKQAEKGSAMENAIEEAKRMFAAQQGGSNGS